MKSGDFRDDRRGEQAATRRSASLVSLGVPWKTQWDQGPIQAILSHRDFEQASHCLASSDHLRNGNLRFSNWARDSQFLMRRPA